MNKLSANEILELIFIYLAEVSATRDSDEVLEILANMGRALTGADRSSVWLVSDDKSTLWTKVAQGIDTISIPIHSGLVGTAVCTGQRILIEDVYKDSRFNREIDKQTGYHTKSMMVIPMYNQEEEIIGAFQVITNQEKSNVFDERDLERLTLASTYAAETLISAKLNDEIIQTQEEIIVTMGAVGESRSKETGNHVKRVAAYSKILALQCGLDEQEAIRLAQASPMHDIGKVGIPDAILNKPGRLNLQETKIMQTHAQKGYDILKNSKRELLKTAAIVAYEHHEKWDGSGYPRGLVAEEIHIFGRITAIADVFDALGSDRVYKKAWSDEKILAFFKEERGRHFDPRLVDIFFDNLDAFYKVREEFKDDYAEKQCRGEESIQVLGAFGAKARGFATSAFLLNQQNVIDAGNLLEPLGEESALIENIWLSHAHLDHISDLAYILDSYFMFRSKTLHVRGEKKTIEALKKYYLNDIIWPDFSKIKLCNSNAMSVEYDILELDKAYLLSEDEKIRIFRTDHSVESCGYVYTKGNRSVLITGDTYSLESVLKELDTDTTINSIVIECSFPSEMESLAKSSKHLTPKLLFEMLKPLEVNSVALYINHIKPFYIDIIMEEIEQYRGKWQVNILKDKEFVNF